jgi:hypothetical protein
MLELLSTSTLLKRRSLKIYKHYYHNQFPELHHARKVVKLDDIASSFGALNQSTARQAWQYVFLLIIYVNKTGSNFLLPSKKLKDQKASAKKGLTLCALGFKSKRNVCRSIPVT